MSDGAERLYERARMLDPEGRTALVEEACRDDPRLRDELLSLLSESEAAEDFFRLFGEAVLSNRIPIAEALNDGAAASPSARPEHRVGARIGRYTIQSFIGSGGMGTVYRAEDTHLERQVALKFLPALSTRLDEEERLLREARAAAALEHPNVCTVHEIGRTDDGRPFIAMALHQGETLKERLEGGPMPPEESVSICLQIARGLGAAHARGILHRDVKPANVILSSDGTARLVDFGLATVLDATVGRADGMPGTAAYMSPEQVRRDPLDARTDLWSLGVVLYEMLTGRRPFHGADDGTLLESILRDAPEPASGSRPVPASLLAILDRLLAKDPAMRYASANEVAAELSRALRGMESRPGTGLRGLAAPIAMVVLTAIVVAGALWLGDRQGSGPDRPSPRRGTNSVAAYELYLHGIDPTLTRTDEGVRQAGRYFEQAIAADSTYAAAYAELSFVHLRMAMAADPGMPLSSLYALAEAAARKAVTLDDSLPEAHQALARARMAMFDFASAETEIRRAIALDPMRTTSHLTLATLHLWQRRPPEALADSRHALELDPLAPIAHAEVARALFASRRYDEALAQLERIEAVRPPVRWAVLIAGLCYSAKRMWPEAVATLRPLAEEGDPMILAFLGHTLARAGQRDEAERILTDLDARRERTGAGTFEVAVVHAGLGDLDQAFERLDASIDDYSLKPEIMSPLFEDLHRDPRFRRLSDRLGLPER